MNMLKLIKNANPLLIQVGCSKDDEVGRLHVSAFPVYAAGVIFVRDRHDRDKAEKCRRAQT